VLQAGVQDQRGSVCTTTCWGIAIAVALLLH
jgi:hypothetical protein